MAMLHPMLHGQEALDALFAEFDGKARPGVAVGVTFEGRSLYARGFGMADIEQQTAVGPETVFRIGSVSKQFTAACVGLLMLRGQVALDAPISTWFPELRAFDPPVLLSDLIHHTSGLPDYVGLLFESGVDSTHYHDNWRELVPRRANGHEQSGDTWLKYNTCWDNVGDGGVFTTVLDMARWESFWLDPGQLTDGEALAELMLTRGSLRDDNELPYAFGINHDSLDGRPTISHAGGWVGFVAEFVRFPEQKVSVVVLANSDVTPSPTLARQVARAVPGSN